MKMKKLAISILIGMVFGFGCAHCSKTVTDFKGKTNGINPYGKGTVNVKRESYWGNDKCVKQLIDKTISTYGIDSVLDACVTIEDINDCVCGETTFLCPRKALENPENVENWDDFCICVEMCMADPKNKENLVQEELELNCSDYCASYADETGGFADGQG